MSLPRPVRAVVFDMDGLLVDTEQVVWKSSAAAAEGMGRELPFDIFKQMLGLAYAPSRHLLVSHFGEDFDMGAWEEAMRGHFLAASEAGIALKAGAVEILDHLEGVGLPRAIATSSTLTSLERSLGPSGIIPHFSALITRDVVENTKPHPEPFLKAAAALGVAPQDCLALEDSHNGVRAAHAAGMMTIMVPDLLDPTEEMHSLCVRIARDLHEVRALLEQHAR